MFDIDCGGNYQDVLYLTSLYPNSIMPLYKIISDYCDKLEHDGSVMFDEFPDKETIRKAANDIFVTITNNFGDQYSLELVETLLINEFLHRRIRRRSFIQSENI